MPRQSVSEKLDREDNPRLLGRDRTLVDIASYNLKESSLYNFFWCELGKGLNADYCSFVCFVCLVRQQLYVKGKNILSIYDTRRVVGGGGGGELRGSDGLSLERKY